MTAGCRTKFRFSDVIRQHPGEKDLCVDAAVYFRISGFFDAINLRPPVKMTAETPRFQKGVKMYEENKLKKIL